MSISLKAFLGLIVSLSLTISANAQSLNDYKLKGKVKSFYKKTYEDSKDGYLDTITPSESIYVDFQNLKETKIHKKLERTKISVKYYNENLNIVFDSVFDFMNNVDITKYYYNSKDKIIQKEIFFNDSIQSTTTYKYDGNNNLVEELLIYNDGDSILQINTYDPNNNQTSTNKYYNNQRRISNVFEFNDKGQIIKEYDPKTVNDYNVHEYDKRGNLIKAIMFMDNEVVIKTRFNYNSQNKLVKVTSYFDGKLNYKTTYTYDNFNRLIKTKRCDYYRDLSIKKEAYSIDNKGRLIEKKTYTFNSIPKWHKFYYKNNNLVKELIYNPDNYYSKNERFEYFYNPNNTLSAKIRYYEILNLEDNTKEEESVKETYYYNDKKENTLIKTAYTIQPDVEFTDSLIYNDNLLIRKYIGEAFLITYKYDEKKRLIEEETNGDEREKIIYKYNDDTLIYKCEEIFDRNGELDCKTTNEWKYDSNKRLIEYIYNHPATSSKTNYFYNSKGKLKKEIYKDNLIENFVVKRYKYKPFSKDYTIVYSDNSNIENVYYKYDDIGNLVEERYPSYLVRFEYEYYE